MKVKLNNKGFAISTMIYSIFLLFLALTATLLALLAYRRTILSAYKNAIYNEVEKMPTVTISNDTVSYDNRLMYDLNDDKIRYEGTLESISLEGYEIPKEEYKTYLSRLTPGEYIFLYKISQGENENRIEINKLRKITITLNWCIVCQILLTNNDNFDTINLMVGEVWTTKGLH